MTTTTRPVLCTIVMLALAGCSQKSNEQAQEATPAPAAQPAPEPSGPTATVAGTVRFEGTPPERKPLKMSADDNCHRQHTDPVLTEDVVVGPGGGLANVFVAITGGLEGRSFATPATPVVLDQKGCVYQPHVFGVMAKQPIKLLNNDPTLHNVHAVPDAGEGEFNVGMPRQGMEITRMLEHPGIVRFKCDVHPWMLSYGIVTTHPFHGVSDATGRWSIAGVPPGQYTVQAWHEVLGTKTGALTVNADGTAAALDFTFAGGS